jgi:hypothetical protein
MEHLRASGTDGKNDDEKPVANRQRGVQKQKKIMICVPHGQMTNDAKKSSRTVSQTWSRETAEEKPGPTQSGLWRTAGHRARQVRSERLGYGIKFHNAGYRALAYIYIYFKL